MNLISQQDCLATNSVTKIEYYHRPIELKKDNKPLTGLHLVFSTYTTPERDYLYFLAKALGGEVNDRYARVQSPILICPTPEGKKYNGALKWSKFIFCWIYRRVCLHNFLIKFIRSTVKDLFSPP